MEVVSDNNFDSNVNTNFAVEVDNINNDEEIQQEIANTIINHAQTYSMDKEEEATKQINFIKPHGSYKNEYGGVWTKHYICSRSGTKQVRNDRVQGGNSQKKRQVQKESKKLVVDYNHNGHTPGSRADVQHLRKSEETITEIKKFARQGLSLSAIRQLMKAPEEITERYFTSKDVVPNRDELLTYEDIYNVIYKEIHSKYHHNNNDAISVLHWANILRNNRENMNNLNDPILSCFQMHSENQKFLLGFHTPWQYKMYQKYHELVHIDSTHNTNSSKYFLFTILIRHPHSGHGVPLAWLILESCDSQTIEIWFRMLKNDGWAEPTAVMLDNDNAEINAIHNVFPHSKIFLCWWHLKRAWCR
ncbi:36197_t:CDS:2 [Racocetra persica]|uniref:36197_t:CDS:1 n=1 Tax=Racocetra persica TaxID=160502 RepID=A0ACA9KCV4_9GLOM|nr:36197_t:CDS:2 [Racocetra persica]